MPLLYETARKGATINEAEIGMIVDKLKPQISGEVRMNKYNRLMYSTDASMYQMTPMPWTSTNATTAKDILSPFIYFFPHSENDPS